MTKSAATEQITGRSYLAGTWISPEGKSFTSIDPRTKSPFNSFTSCGIKEVEMAAHEAISAYHVYRAYDGKQIGAFLHAIADEIEALGDILLEVGDKETGLGIPRLTGERGRTCGQIRAFADLVIKGEWVQASIDTADPNRQPVPKPDLRRMMRPIGPVAVFGASNFPFAFGVVGGDTASALAAGNPVIVKGHSAHPGTSELFAVAVEKAIEKTGVPKGVFSMLQGANRELGTSLVKHPDIQAVGFTGSVGGGRALVDLAANRPQPIPVYAEMGSINPVFIGPATLASQVAQIAPALAGSVCLGTGQFCTSPGLVVTVSNDDFENQLQEALNNNPKGVMLNPRIADALVDGLSRLKDHPKVTWLNEQEIEEGTMTPPNSVLKTSGDAFLADHSLWEEVFGPVTLIVDCSDVNQMLEVAGQLEGNLTGSVHSDDDPALLDQLIPLLEQKVGRIIYNGYPTGVEVNSSQQHGGPYPSSSVANSTSVGMDAIVRFSRFVAYQEIPDGSLPKQLQSANPLGIFRKVNGTLTQEAIK
ncbi:MAG: aldehyde dehydrogenase (NADP(+)) [Cyclobacteriaceae bacterium]